jgi:Ca-activated chloride channel homolog
MPLLDRNRVLLVWCALGVLLSAATPGQDGPQVDILPRALTSGGRPSSIRVGVNMVMVPITVTDRHDTPILDLRKDELHLFEGDQEQKIESFAIDEAPASIGIVFDSSGSMVHRIDGSRAAVRQFMQTSSPEDEFFLVQFSDVPQLLVRFTPHPDDIIGQLQTIRAQGWTSLFDAIYLAANQMRRSRNSRKALMVLSDGGDNQSRYTEREVIDMLREADVRVFAIGLFDNASFLKKAAAETGGCVLVVHNINDLPSAVDKLNRVLRSEYLLGYYPAEVRNDGKFRRVRVLVDRTVGGQKLRTSWRHGYYAPYGP